MEIKRSRQLDYYYRNKKKINSKSKIKYNALKTLMVAYKGYKCINCEEHLNIRSLEFHHNRDDKETDLSNMMAKFSKLRTTTTEHIYALKTEADKCDLLCRNCHSKHHELEANNVNHYRHMIKLVRKFSFKFGMDFNSDEFRKNYLNILFRGDD